MSNTKVIALGTDLVGQLLGFGPVVQVLCLGLVVRFLSGFGLKAKALAFNF